MILFLAAKPAGSGGAALEQECQAVEHELKLASRRDDFEFRSKWAVTVDDLFRHIEELQPTIIHFCGQAGSAGPALVDEHGVPKAIGAAALAGVIRTTSHRARLVVFSACESEDHAKALSDAVGCAIGMAGEMSDYDARKFAVGLYRAIGNGRSVQVAYDQACASLAAHGCLGEPLARCVVRPGVRADALHLHQDIPAEPLARGSFPPGELHGAPTASEPPSARNVDRTVRYDLFLTRPSAIRASARALYDLLQRDVRLFLDECSLRPGERWDQQAPAAQRASRTTVILISSRADTAWYLSREFVTAIELHLASPDGHLLLPLLLEPGITVPYVLRDIPAIAVTAAAGLAGAAVQLREHVATLHRTAPAALPPPLVPSSAGTEHFRLHDRLCRLSDSVFEQIVSRVPIDRDSMSPRTAPLASRALDLAQLAALDPQVCRRIAVELDRRAPWTRR